MPTETIFLGVPGAIWLALLVIVASALFARRMYHLLRILAQGRKENRFDHLGLRLWTFAREVLGQARLLRGESIINWAHPLIFWGFCLFVIASALLFLGGIAAPWFHIPQAEEIPVVGTCIDLFAVVVLIALMASSFRRYVLKPPGLQRTADASIVVLLIAALMVTYLFAEAGGHARSSEHGQTFLPAGAALGEALLGLGVAKETVIALGVGCWWIHALILLFFLVYLPYSKHMHLIWAPFAVFFAELPHKGVLSAAGDKTTETPQTPLGQFTWRMLLNAYACAECGRCERVCPATASGAPLSPREIIHDLKGFVLSGGKANSHAGPANGESKDFIGGVVTPETLWACTTCYGCVEKCPVRNEHVALIVQMRRKLIEEGKIDDSSMQEALQSLQRYGNSQGKSPRKRFDWAKDLPVPLKDARKEPVNLLWFVGDYAAFHPSSMRVSRLVALVFQAAGVNFGVLGDSEQSAGNDVRRLGEEGLFEMLAEKNLKALGKASFDRIVTTDPHTYHTLKHEYGRFGLNKPILHYTEILDELLSSGRLKLKQPLTGSAVYHDPCYLGRYNGIYDPPRRIIASLGLKQLEMPRNQDESFCCGAGGGRIWMKDTPNIKERPAENRIREALAVPGVEYFVVACPKDLAMFQDAVKTVGAEDRLRVVDLGELVYQAMGEPVASSVDSTRARIT